MHPLPAPAPRQTLQQLTVIAQRQDRGGLQRIDHLAYRRGAVVAGKVDAVAMTLARGRTREPLHHTEDVMCRLVSEVGIDDLQQVSPKSMGSRITDVDQHQVALLSVLEGRLDDRPCLGRRAVVEEDQH